MGGKSTQSKKDAKLALKERPQARHNGHKVELMQLGLQARKCETCDRLFGKRQMVVEHDRKFYCDWNCSDQQ